MMSTTLGVWKTAFHGLWTTLARLGISGSSTRGGRWRRLATSRFGLPLEQFDAVRDNVLALAQEHPCRRTRCYTGEPLT